MDTTQIAAGNYTAARPATEPTWPNSAPASEFPGIVRSFADTLRSSEALAKQAMSGDADPHALVQALAQSELAVETAVTIRNRVVEAYQEILRMPV